MTIERLKELIEDLPDDMQVLIPAEPREGFTGEMWSPCSQDSGVIGLPDHLGVDENKFFLCPCAFFNTENEHKHLN